MMKGGSGVQQSYISEAIRNGIAKINIGTEIRQPYERALAAGGTTAEAQAAVFEAVKRLICTSTQKQGSASRFRRFHGEQQ